MAQNNTQIGLKIKSTQKPNIIFAGSFEMFTIESLQKFKKNNCIIERNLENERIYDYAEVLEAVNHLCQKFQQLNISESVCFAVKLKDGLTASAVVLLLAILNHRCHFCPLQDYGSYQEFSDILLDCDASFLISNDTLLQQPLNCKMQAEIKIFDEIFHLYSVRDNITKSKLPLNICYTIGTSGSTGRPKMVHVPYDCIAPNIHALCARFQITSGDIIFLGTPVTFDPFVVELFMALSCGAALMITTQKLRLVPKNLLQILWPQKSRQLSATVLQMTPSLFRQFGVESIRDFILDRKSSLRILILGGEEFPKIAEFKKWLPQDGSLHKRIFNIYGITELSCWSTIYEFNFEILGKKCIPIGKPIDDETTLRIAEIEEESLNGVQRGELLVGSATRKTYIPQVDDNNSYGKNKDAIFYRHTGDLVECNESDEIYYLGRLNNIIKRMGMRINLDLLEQKIENFFPAIENFKVLCLWESTIQSLICCLKYHTSLESNQSFHIIKSQIMQQLSNYEKPDWIVHVQDLPLNKHGKVDRKKLLKEICTTRNAQPVDILRSFLNETLLLGIEECDIFHSSTTLPAKIKKLSAETSSIKKSFSALGGTSFHALSLATEIGRYLTNSYEQRQLLEKFLDAEISVEEILRFLENASTCGIRETSVSKPTISSVERLKFLWRVDLLKCVDATPALDIEQRYICIGSHAHLLITVDTLEGKEISRLKLRNRIECEAVFVSSDLALIGCNAGFLYAFNFLSGELHWSLYIGSKVKARPLVIDTIHALIGCYDEEFNLVYICLKTQNIKWRRQISSKPIFASPIRLDNQTVLVCTLDGTYARLDIPTGNTLWTRKCVSPIFSTPTIIENGVTIGIAEVGGKVHICKIENGEILQTFSVDGNIFSNLTIHQASDTIIQIILGCHDHHVYCLNYVRSSVSNAKESNFSQHWKTKLDAAIYATPIVAQSDKENYVIACSTVGLLNILDLSNGSLIETKKVEGEVFSTPCCISNGDGELRIYFGCRDNFLYCFRFYKK